MQVGCYNALKVVEPDFFENVMFSQIRKKVPKMADNKFHVFSKIW